MARAKSSAASRRTIGMTLGSALALAGSLAATEAAAQFYLGPSYLEISGTPGDAKEPAYRNWIRAEARFWTERPQIPELRGNGAPKNDLFFTATTAPASGPDVLTLAIDKTSRGLAVLMDKCRKGERIAEVRYAESTEIARHPQEHGQRPAGVPDFQEMLLGGVRLSCPVAAGAPEQAIRLHFETIRWLNSERQDKPQPLSVLPATLTPIALTGQVRTFAVNWFAPAVDSRPDQCPRMNTKPGDADYFAFVPPDKAAKIRAELKNVGVGPKLMPYRGPDGLDVTFLPGIVPDPGHFSPQADVILGIDLDGDLGVSAAPRGIRAHQNFRAPDGRQGIDNQLFTVEGCVEGLRRRGFLPMIFNESRGTSRPTALIQISGIDDPQRDDEVWVTFFYSTDQLRRSPAKVPLGDFTYSVTANPEYAQDFMRVRGKIVDGVVVTDTAEHPFHMHESFGIESALIQPKLRLRMTAEGSLKGVVGGYLDWRKRVIFQIFRSSDYENTIGFQIPAIYNAMKRAADGLKNPATGDYDGISAAFEVEGVPAFVPPDQQAALAAGTTAAATTAMDQDSGGAAQLPRVEVAPARAMRSTSR